MLFVMTSLSDCKNLENSSSAVVNSVDILTQILLLLPVKSLLVYKSVSKQWLSIISDPFFSHKYSLQNSRSIQGLCTQTIPFFPADVSPKLDYVPLGASSSSAPFNSLSFIGYPSGLLIVQSCNGLMLCRTFCATIHHRKYYIFNPSTRQYRPIICECEKHESCFELLSTVRLAYDPRKSPHYKVVCIWLVSKSETAALYNYQIEIYSSETASWKLSGEVFSRPVSSNFFNGVFWNGSLHWIDKKDSFCFDVDRELRIEMPLPDYYYKKHVMVVHYFGECQGHLYLIASQTDFPTSFEILEMKTDYSEWSIKYLVNLQELIIAYPTPPLIIYKQAYPRLKFDVLVVMEEEGESPNMVLRLPALDKIITFDLKDMSFEETFDLKDMSFKEIKQLEPDYRRQNVAYQYIPSLACV